MRYMHKKIHFNKFELKELEKRNPTLFDLAKYVSKKAHITAVVLGKNWVNVSTSSNGEVQMLCPSEVFNVPNTGKKIVDHACGELYCWSIHKDTNEIYGNPYRPCWFRRWNDFVSDMKGE